MSPDFVGPKGSSMGSGERELVSAAWAQFERITSDRKSARISTSCDVSFPGYRILGEIHRGGQGVVYQALQESTRRKVAIKVPKEGPFADPSELARFDREVDVLSRLNHPHIVAIHDRGLSAGHDYYVMDYIAGQSLDAHVAAAKLSIEETLSLIIKVCDAVNVAHLRGVIHRDLKPGNIRVDEDGQPRILDFGLAKLVQEVAESSSAQGMTLTGQFVGSLPWASPEQVGGTGEQVSSSASPAPLFPCSSALIDIRTDVYSLGVILYHLLTGRFPYPVTGRIDDVVRHISQTVPARPSSLRRIDHDLELIVLKSLAKEPKRRYQSAGDFANDLRRFLAHKPVTATSPSAAYRLRKFARRNRGAVIAGAAVAIALLVGTVVSLTFGLCEAQQRGVAELARARAQEAEAQARTRADELERVAKFQAGQLSGINAQAMGLKIRAALLKKARDAADRAKIPREQAEAQVSELETLIAGSDFTGLALDTLNENVFARALEAIQKQFADQPVVKARLLQTLASTMQRVGLIEGAAGPQKEALAIRRQTLGDDDPDTLHSINESATLLHAQSKLADAEVYYREALERRRRTLGEDHPDTLSSINNLAVVLMNQARFEESERYFKEALEKYHRTLGDDHPDTLASNYELGRLLLSWGKLADAERYLREACDKRRKVLGDDHPDTINSIGEMGTALRNQGKFPDAEKYNREALERSRRVLGDDHPDTLTSINGMGTICEVQGKFPEAESFYRESLERRRRVLGEDHNDTIASIMSVGAVLKGQGRLDEAEPFLLQALEKYRRVLGSDHPLTFVAIGNMGLLRRAQGRYDEAEGYYREALEGRRRVLGENHPSTLLTMGNLCFLLFTQGKLTDAEPLCREALEKRRSISGDEHPDTLASMIYMGQVLVAQGRPVEAEPFCRLALDNCRKVLGDQHTDTLGAICLMGKLFVAQDRPADAVALLVPAEPAARSTFTGGNAMRLGRFLVSLGRARVANGELVAAESILTEANDILSESKTTTNRERTELCDAMVRLYDAWHAAEPEKSHDVKATEWRTRLQALKPAH